MATIWHFKSQCPEVGRATVPVNFLVFFSFAVWPVECPNLILSILAPAPLCLCSSWIVATLQPNLLRFDSNQFSSRNPFFPSMFGLQVLVVIIWFARPLSLQCLTSRCLCEGRFCCQRLSSQFCDCQCVVLFLRFPKCKVRVLIPSILIQPLPNLFHLQVTLTTCSNTLPSPAHAL